ncbi:MAG: hypothetical protein KDA90_23540 [Planctomycetaceae bacterium]|nr:hypothetical protein [Planctomycetaceae bacterium]
MKSHIHSAWNRFLQEMELAKNYHMPYLLDGIGAATFRNPLLDFLLPSLLYVNMVAILDEALIRFIDVRGLTVPKKKYRNSLHGRIEFLNDKLSIDNYSELQSIRDLRNKLAHEVSEHATWETLDADSNTIDKELRHLGFVGERKDYKYFGERSAMYDCGEPNILSAQDYHFGVKHDDQVTMEFSFTKKIHKSNG